MVSILALLACATPLRALGDPPTPPTLRLMPVVGTPQKILVGVEDTLLDIAFEHRVGYDALIRLNPEANPWLPTPGTVLLLPSVYVLPAYDPRNLVINVPEMRLYDFSVDPPEVLAAAIGDMADPSLLGSFRIGEKRENPEWRVPASIRAEDPDLPAVVPPGPDNPLGSRWMTIGATSFGIHGTNTRWSIGRMATHGCIRLYEDDVQRLFARIPQGTPIQLVYQPFKWGVRGDGIFLEVHPDVYERSRNRMVDALRTPHALGLLAAIDLKRVRQTLEEVRGVPVAVGRLQGPPASPATWTQTW